MPQWPKFYYENDRHHLLSVFIGFYHKGAWSPFERQETKHVLQLHYLKSFTTYLKWQYKCSFYLCNWYYLILYNDFHMYLCTYTLRQNLRHVHTGLPQIQQRLHCVQTPILKNLIWLHFLSPLCLSTTLSLSSEIISLINAISLRYTTWSSWQHNFVFTLIGL